MPPRVPTTMNTVLMLFGGGAILKQLNCSNNLKLLSGSFPTCRTATIIRYVRCLQFKLLFKDLAYKANTISTMFSPSISLKLPIWITDHCGSEVDIAILQKLCNYVPRDARCTYVGCLTVIENCRGSLASTAYSDPGKWMTARHSVSSCRL